MEWINAEERLPEKDTFVIAVVSIPDYLSGEEKKKAIKICGFTKDGRWSDGDFGFYNKKSGMKVLYWMPLPTLPPECEV